MVTQGKRTRLFVGFSSQSQKVSDWKLYDIDLVKQDLTNNFHTRKGERLMMPNYGTIIWDLIFEPFDESLVAKVEDDVLAVINNEPRVSLQNLTITEYEYGLQVDVDLLFIPFNTVDSLKLIFDRQQAAKK
jgi:phage baseplate assembly protein W